MNSRPGEIVWSEREALGRGSVTYADGNLYCCAEKGGVVALVEATPKGWNERAAVQIASASEFEPAPAKRRLVDASGGVQRAAFYPRPGTPVLL